MQAQEFLLSLGIIFLLGLSTDFLGKYTFLPRVTLLIIFGIFIGDEGMAILPAELVENFDIITNITMIVVGFLLGGKLTFSYIKSTANCIFSIASCAALGSVILVSIGLMLSGLPVEICIILGCISAATDPVATVEVIRESGIKNRFTKILYGVVALDDVIGVIIFAIGMTILSTSNHNIPLLTTLTGIAHEIIGGLLLGFILGLPASILTGRLKHGEPMLLEGLALVFICAGLSLWLEVSIIIAAMAMGSTISNLATHHRHPFHEIENIEWPFMVLFFTLAGASLDIQAVQSIGLIGIIYIIFRSAGKYSGAWLGAQLTRQESLYKNYTGLAMLPQAGIAMGMALIASHYYPDHRQLILSVIIATTIVFEIVGPLITRICILKTRQA